MKKYRRLSLLLGMVLLVLLFTLTFFKVKGDPLERRLNQVVEGNKKVFIPFISVEESLRPAPNSPPLATASFYFWMKYYTPEKARAEGCRMGQRDETLPGVQDSLVILDFGLTKYQNGQYGASGMRGPGYFYSMSQIAEAVEQFGLGYWTCTGSDYESHLSIGIGTNNYDDSDPESHLSVTYGHGREWAKMVNTVNTYFQTQCKDACNGQVSAVGANDIELAWSSADAAIAWLDGYDSANNYPLINFGAAEGCPNFCGGAGHSWTKEQVWRVQNSGPVYALPEIYLNSGTNANQWYLMSQYSVQAHGRPYDFIGVMTTYGACKQYPESACEYIDNTPDEGWTQLYNRVNGTDLNTWDSITYATDICWLEFNGKEDLCYGR